MVLFFALSYCDLLYYVCFVHFLAVFGHYVGWDYNDGAIEPTQVSSQGQYRIKLPLTCVLVL